MRIGRARILPRKWNGNGEWVGCELEGIIAKQKDRINYFEIATTVEYQEMSKFLIGKQILMTQFGSMTRKCSGKICVI